MLYVFIDTNVLIRFYKYTDDTLNEVEKLSALIKARKIRLLITDQIVDEHARNRDHILADSLKRLDQTTISAQIPRFAEHHDAAREFMAAMTQAKVAKTALMTAIRAEITEGQLRADKVILDMFASTKPLPRTPLIVERARLRRELNNPPGKPDSLGDQINWKILIEHVPEDAELHVISKDGDFKSEVNSERASFFLRGEWHHKKKAQLHLYNGLAEFTKKHFPHIKVPSDALKSAALDAFVNSLSYASTRLAVKDLMAVIDEISAEEAVVLLQSATQNTRISDIIGDDDVDEVLRRLHTEHFWEIPATLDVKLNELRKQVDRETVDCV